MFDFENGDINIMLSMINMKLRDEFSSLESFANYYSLTKEEIVKTIEELCQRKLLSEEVMVVCETDKAVELPEEVAELGILKQKIYGISKVTVYVR